LDIDGDTGEVLIKSTDDVEKIQPFKAMEIVTAIGRGFSPENAMTLLQGENTLHVIDLREFAGKSNANIERIKGRIIGESGRARRNMENLTNTHISVYGKTVSIIGDSSKLRLAVDAIAAISSGGMHGAVYDKLEAANRKTKQEKMQLWEDQDVFY
jgi:ribosomal RNA assembly protein